MAMKKKKTLGSQTAAITGSMPPMANCFENCMNRIYEKLITTPMAICKPIPPLIYREDTATPISVRINREKGKAIRLWRSIW